MLLVQARSTFAVYAQSSRRLCSLLCEELSIKGEHVFGVTEHKRRPFMLSCRRLCSLAAVYAQFAAVYAQFAAVYAQFRRLCSVPFMLSPFFLWFPS